MSKKLKPCPFCGSKNLYIGNFDGPLEDGMTVYIRCLDCGATIEGEGVNEVEIGNILRYIECGDRGGSK